MEHEFEKYLTVTFSGIRMGEEAEVCELLSHCGLNNSDITREKLVNFLAARWGGAIAGVIGLEIVAEDGLVRSLAVTDKFRGQHVARDLTTAIEGYARSKGVKTLYLMTTTGETFFAARGFEPIERESAPQLVQALKEFQRFGEKTAVCMVKKIVG